jgi:nitrite reductase/ring-hydroxylating ferredoxin subunit
MTLDAAAMAAQFPAALRAPGTSDAAYLPLLQVTELAPGDLRRVSHGDLDVLLACTATGIFAVEDRCPHMAAPLSIGRLDGCVVACPLHNGRFDLATGDPVQMPTTGGLDPDGRSHPTWSPPGSEPKPEAAGKKAEARRLTRVRRFRYFPVQIRDGWIEVALPRP